MPNPAKRAPSTDQTALLRRLPSVDELLLRPPVAAICKTLERGYGVEIVREVLAQVRREISSGELMDQAAIEPGVLEQRVVMAVETELAPSLRPVINASGVILHTNLGRAPITPAAIAELQRSATQYSNLEYDLSAGARGKRDVHLSRLIERLTGAEAAIVVNNCAAAVLLTLAALARGGEVIVSRGELIEIGDGFRIPEIMEQSGATLRTHSASSNQAPATAPTVESVTLSGSAGASAPCIPHPSRRLHSATHRDDVVSVHILCPRLVWQPHGYTSC